MGNEEIKIEENVETGALSVSLKARAKINLGLRIEGLREDGYHLLRSRFQLIDLYDSVKLKLIFSRPLGGEVRKERLANGERARIPEIRVKMREEGVFFASPARGRDNEAKELIRDEDNLARRAAELFFGELSKGKSPRPSENIEAVEIDLVKRIPMGAGLGGGSSDAAAVLRGLNAALGAYAPEELAALGARLGADVPFFVYGNSAAEVSGIGELVEAAEPLAAELLLVKPGASLSTAEVYREYDRTGSAQAENELEGAAFSLCPELRDLKEGLETELCGFFSIFSASSEAPVIRMSGSGSCLYALLPEEKETTKGAVPYHEALISFLQTKLKSFTETTKIKGIFITVVRTIAERR